MRAELVESIRAAIEEAQRRADTTGREVVVVAVTPASRPPAKPDEFNRPWKADFLAELRRGKSVKHAAELAGVSSRHAYRCRKEDPTFARSWKMSQCDVTKVIYAPG